MGEPKQRPDYNIPAQGQHHMKKRLKIRITTIRQQTIVSRGEALHLLCPACGREVEMVTSAQAKIILEADDETLDAMVAAGQVHAVKTLNGNTRVCKESLFLR